MQISYFSNGGFVIHKIVGLSQNKISAWYDSTGSLVDCEYIKGDIGVRVSKAHKHILSALQTIGCRYRK